MPCTFFLIFKKKKVKKTRVMCSTIAAEANAMLGPLGRRESSLEHQVHKMKLKNINKFRHPLYDSHVPAPPAGMHQRFHGRSRYQAIKINREDKIRNEKIAAQTRRAKKMFAMQLQEVEDHRRIYKGGTWWPRLLQAHQIDRRNAQLRERLLSTAPIVKSGAKRTEKSAAISCQECGEAVANTKDDVEQKENVVDADEAGESKCGAADQEDVSNKEKVSHHKEEPNSEKEKEEGHETQNQQKDKESNMSSNSTKKLPSAKPPRIASAAGQRYSRAYPMMNPCLPKEVPTRPTSSNIRRSHRKLSQPPTTIRSQQLQVGLPLDQPDWCTTRLQDVRQEHAGRDRAVAAGKWKVLMHDSVFPVSPTRAWSNYNPDDSSLPEQSTSLPEQCTPAATTNLAICGNKNVGDTGTNVPTAPQTARTSSAKRTSRRLLEKDDVLYQRHPFTVTEALQRTTKLYQTRPTSATVPHISYPAPVLSGSSTAPISSSGDDGNTSSTLKKQHTEESPASGQNNEE